MSVETIRSQHSLPRRFRKGMLFTLKQQEGRQIEKKQLTSLRWLLLTARSQHTHTHTRMCLQRVLQTARLSAGHVCVLRVVE